MTLVCHGGGEPGLHIDLLAGAVEMVEAIAAATGVPLFRTIATNGALPAASAAWIARRFDRVGLSCDGPPDIQARQRPLWGGARFAWEADQRRTHAEPVEARAPSLSERRGEHSFGRVGGRQHALWGGHGSAALVERAAAIVHEHGTPLHVRVTITPQTVARQEEIAEYLCRVLQPADIHVEPVYAAGRAAEGGGGAWSPEDADRFVAGFLAGQREAERHGVPWRSSGSRPGEPHGPYCNVFRDVLNLIPGGAATGCFLETTSDAAGRRQVAIGRQDGAAIGCQDGAVIGCQDGAGFSIDQAGVAALRGRLMTPPAACDACFNRYHCAGACPDACELDGPQPGDGYLCRVRRRLAEAEIDALADRLWQAYTGTDGCIGQAIH